MKTILAKFLVLLFRLILPAIRFATFRAEKRGDAEAARKGHRLLEQYEKIPASKALFDAATAKK
jgi:hypothetical protein